MRLLLVEDDPMVADAVRSGLRQSGYTVDAVRDGTSAEVAARTEPYSLVLLDLGLPRKDGLAVLRSLRGQGHHVPVLILTARDAVEDRVAGLDAGADDYLVKPFSLAELLARVRAITRRHGGRSASVLTHGALTLNPSTRKVFVAGREIALSAREFEVLEVLLERPGSVLSRAQIEERLYGWGEEIGSNSVEVHIHHLRKKLGTGVIRNLRGVGYTIGSVA
ncbi:MAG: response regulator [Betaproteobacteria bacterium]|nr:response regulator [Betaproteobacteria bacterium]